MGATRVGRAALAWLGAGVACVVLVGSRPVQAADGVLDAHYGIRSLPMTAFVVLPGATLQADGLDPSLTLLGGGVDFLNYRIGRSGRLSLLSLSAFALGLSYEEALSSKSGNRFVRFGVIRVGPHLVHMEPVGPLGLKLGLQMGFMVALGPKRESQFSPAGYALGFEVLSLTLTWLHDEPEPVNVHENFFDPGGTGAP
ncbi:MAG: hypothetical protein FJ100_08100 [Deltaproteobacteria bacterium]|nr:hypothetical protein [Deltaproteobacteria bacterium]